MTLICLLISEKRPSRLEPVTGIDSTAAKSPRSNRTCHRCRGLEGRGCYVSDDVTRRETSGKLNGDDESVDEDLLGGMKRMREDG